MHDLFSSPGDAKVRRHYGATAVARRKRRRKTTRVVGVVAATITTLVLVFAGLAQAHHIEIDRDCDTVTIKSFSDGTMSILTQTGDVFHAGQTAPPGNPGLLVKPATPDQTGSVTVTWTTDSSHETVGWGKATGCEATTTTTAPSTTTTEHQTTTTTAPETTTTTAPVTTTTAPTTTSTSEATTTTTAPATTTTTDCVKVGTVPPDCDIPTIPTTTIPSVTTVCTGQDTGSDCDHPNTTVPTVIVCDAPAIAHDDGNGNVTCLVPPTAQAAAPPINVTPSFTG